MLKTQALLPLILFFLRNILHGHWGILRALFAAVLKKSDSGKELGVKTLSNAVLGCVVIVAGLSPLSAQVQGQWAGTGAMQSARELNSQVRIAGGKVLSVGGVDNSGNILNSAETYSSSSGKWALTGSMSLAREAFPAVVLTSGKVLVSGGVGTGSVVLGATELYDPKTGLWSSAGSLSGARFGHSATLLKNGKVLVTGGCTVFDCNTVTAVSELYDPTTNTWTTTGSLNTARYDHTAVLLKTGKLLAIGGLPVTTSCELYDPSTGAWSVAPSTSGTRYLNTTTLLSDGKVLVTGGANTRYKQNSAEIYDPTANTWTPTGNMTIGRYAHTASLLTDGTVLVAGGYGQSISCGKDCTGYIPTSKVDVFNETAGTLTATAGLSQAVAYHSMTVLSNGRAIGKWRQRSHERVLHGREHRQCLYPAVADVFRQQPELRASSDRTQQPTADRHSDECKQLTAVTFS